MKITQNKLFRSLMIFTLAFGLAFYFAACVNVNQRTTLNSDGSGTIKLEYWAKMSNLKSSTELGSFSFKEDKAKQNYTSSNSEVTSFKIEDKLDDSTKHVYMDIKFKDFNNLTSTKGFEKTKASWKEGKEGKDFMFTLLQDTSNAKTMGSSDYKLTYTFEFPGEVTQTNGRKDGKSVVWEKSLADLKKDVEMTATVKDEGKKCGLFGIEMPLVFALGMTLLAGLKRKK
ncbi:MAG TPA: hypothetical protein PK605_05855 [Ignavibacteria bacterium]|mgnify:CR=1 FL=1|nr:hypothetical protein [Bacteroidota bacterium]HRE09583.1 hypothetical protein [Ignavibacteria bacterium]HRF64398.1 hypothetical protein [Ignavibacteria bacterium]HRJ03911.1 hypothetical protein [Ignavibacteria bacterium]HRJ86855.1 hypothetical protein [Ignavibacteria bacterium]